MTTKVGFCAVHFEPTGKYTRWPVLDEWQHLGAHTLARVTQIVDDHIAASTANPEASKDQMVQKLLVELVVEAAAQMDVKTTPCRSSALMQHLGRPCFLIDTGGPGANTVRALETTSWQDAGEMIDQLEASTGDSFLRIRSKGDRVVVLSRDGGLPPVPPTGTLIGQLESLEKHLQNSDPKIPKGLRPFLNRSIPKTWHRF